MDIYTRAYLGAKAADAVAMPVHWYYDTAALDRDYSGLREYRAPAGRHPDSILWRSSYAPVNAEGDILHDQNTNGEFAMTRGYVAFFFQYLDGEDGAGKAQCKTDQGSGREINTAKRW